MASSKKGDGFREDFSSMFDLGAPKQAPVSKPRPPKKQEKKRGRSKDGNDLLLYGRRQNVSSLPVKDAWYEYI